MQENINKKALKAGIWYTISNFIVRGMSFITTPIFTRILSKEDYGAFSNYSSWLTILIIITTFELSTSVNRARFDYEDDMDGYLSSIAVCGTCFTAIFYVTVIIFSDFFLNFFGMNMVCVHIMFIYLLVEPAFNLLSAKYRLEMKYKAVTSMTLLSTLSSVLFSLLLVTVMDNQFLGRVIGYTAPLIVLNVVLYIFIINRGRKVCLQYWRYSLGISLPLVPHALSGHILGSTDRIMITQICGAADNAIYSVVNSCAQIITILLYAVNQAWAPWFYEKLNAVEYEDIRRISQKYISLFAFCSFLFMLGAPELVLIMGGREYLEAAYLMPPIMMGCVLQFLYTLYVNVEIFHKKTFGISVRTMAAAFVNLATNAVLLPVFGYQAAAYTTLLGYFILFVLHYMAAKKLDTDEFYNNRAIWKVVVAMILLSGVALISYNFTVLRYALAACSILVMGINVYRFRKEILNFIKK